MRNSNLWSLCSAKPHKEFSASMCFYVSFPRWIFFDNCFRMRTKTSLCSFLSHVCKRWAAGASDGFVLWWLLVHAVVWCSLSWIYSTDSEQHGVSFLLAQHTSWIGAAFASLCRELSRKMQLQIFKPEHAKCLIFVLPCVVFPIALPCYFRTISPLSLGDLGLVTLAHSFTAICSFIAALLTGFPPLFFWLKISVNAKWCMTTGVSSKKYFHFANNLCSLAFFMLCGYWGLKCDLTEKDDQNFFCMTG